MLRKSQDNIPNCTFFVYGPFFCIGCISTKEQFMNVLVNDFLLCYVQIFVFYFTENTESKLCQHRKDLYVHRETLEEVCKQKLEKQQPICIVSGQKGMGKEFSLPCVALHV